MARMVKIEAQKDNGQWYQMAVVINNDFNIKRHLELAAKSPVAKKTKRARAVDVDSGAIIDIYQI